MLLWVSWPVRHQRYWLNTAASLLFCTSSCCHWKSRLLYMLCELIRVGAKLGRGCMVLGGVLIIIWGQVSHFAALTECLTCFSALATQFSVRCEKQWIDTTGTNQWKQWLCDNNTLVVATMVKGRSGGEWNRVGYHKEVCENKRLSIITEPKYLQLIFGAYVIRPTGQTLNMVNLHISYIVWLHFITPTTHNKNHCWQTCTFIMSRLLSTVWF